MGVDTPNEALAGGERLDQEIWGARHWCGPSGGAVQVAQGPPATPGRGASGDRGLATAGLVIGYLLLRLVVLAVITLVVLVGAPAPTESPGMTP